MNIYLVIGRLNELTNSFLKSNYMTPETVRQKIKQIREHAWSRIRVHRDIIDKIDGESDEAIGEIQEQCGHENKTMQYGCLDCGKEGPL